MTTFLSAFISWDGCEYSVCVCVCVRVHPGGAKPHPAMRGAHTRSALCAGQVTVLSASETHPAPHHGADSEPPGCFSRFFRSSQLCVSHRGDRK